MSSGKRRCLRCQKRLVTWQQQQQQRRRKRLHHRQGLQQRSKLCLHQVAVLAAGVQAEPPRLHQHHALLVGRLSRQLLGLG